MEQYISKSALLAEIDNLLDKGKYHDDYDCAFRDGNNAALYALKGRIDNLEVKEVKNTELLKVRGYLVRDKDDYTAIYAEKPHRGKTEWVDSNDSCLMTINDARLMPDIEFEDKPVEVEVTLI
jgi:hypothetical protein